MILCICNALSEDEVRAAARRGAPCVETAYRSLGCELQCGTCRCYAPGGREALRIPVDRARAEQR